MTLRSGRILSLFVVGLAVAAGACRRDGPRGRGSVRGGPPYDVGPLLVALRPEVRQRLPAQLGLASLGELPFYDIQLALDAQRAAVHGQTVLYFRNATGRALAELPLLLHPNAPRELGAEGGELRVLDARARAGPAVSVARQRPTLVALRFARPLRPGELAVIAVRFAGTLRRLPAGSNDVFSQALASLGVFSAGGRAADYGLLAVGDGLYAIASAYPMLAPLRGETFDTPSPGRFGDLACNDLANYRLRLDLPAGFSAVTNLADQPARPGAGRVQHLAVGAANRDLAIVAGRSLARVSEQVGAVRLSSVFLAADRAGGTRALRTAREALALFEQRFGPYPFAELDVAEATLVGGAGGVEFPGMVLVAGMFYQAPSQGSSPLTALLRTLGGLGELLRGEALEAKLPPALARIDEVLARVGAFTVAHEIAHQYFAGVVGSDCRRDPALDEPLAQFAAAEHARATLGAAAGDALLATNAKLTYAVYRMLGGPDLPAAQPVDRFPSSLAYAAIVYGKAPYFYEALRERLGAERLGRALRHAVDAHRFRRATLDGWIAALEQGAGGASSGVRALAQRWLHERHGDADLHVDPDGEQLLAQLLGERLAGELKQGLGALGLSPRELLRMLLPR